MLIVQVCFESEAGYGSFSSIVGKMLFSEKTTQQQFVAESSRPISYVAYVHGLRLQLTQVGENRSKRMKLFFIIQRKS